MYLPQVRNPASLTIPPTFHGAFAANGLKRAYLIQFRRARWPAQLTATAASTVWFEAFSMFPAPRRHEGLIPVTSLTSSPPLARALAERNFDSLTPVQTAVLADDAA